MTFSPLKFDYLCLKRAPISDTEKQTVLHAEAVTDVFSYDAEIMISARSCHYVMDQTTPQFRTSILSEYSG